MKYYTKEWQKLLEYLGTIETYEPVIDKEYSDREIADLYEDMMDKYVSEDREAYDEPPLFMMEMLELDSDEFDPEDYLIGDLDEDGNESNLRNPASYEELMEYQKKEFEFEMKEYENRPPFDEESSREEFAELYEDNLEDPDLSLPEWVREEVDPRLIAMNLLPEGVYKQLLAEENEKQELFDALDEAADAALEAAAESIPCEMQDIIEEFDDMDGDYVIGVRREYDDASGQGPFDLAVELYGWNFDGDGVIRTLRFEKAEILEDEGLTIEVEKDEDGDYESNCDLSCHEVYYEDDRYEVHLMFENDDVLKYLTLRCDGFCCTEEIVEISED